MIFADRCPNFTSTVVFMRFLRFLNVKSLSSIKQKALVRAYSLIVELHEDPFPSVAVVPLDTEKVSGSRHRHTSPF